MVRAVVMGGQRKMGRERRRGNYGQQSHLGCAGVELARLMHTVSDPQPTQTPSPSSASLLSKAIQSSPATLTPYLGRRSHWATSGWRASIRNTPDGATIPTPMAQYVWLTRSLHDPARTIPNPIQTRPTHRKTTTCPLLNRSHGFNIFTPTISFLRRSSISVLKNGYMLRPLTRMNWK